MIARRLTTGFAFFVGTLLPLIAIANVPMPTGGDIATLRHFLEAPLDTRIAAGMRADSCTLEGDVFRCENVSGAAGCAASWSEVGSATRMRVGGWWVDEAILTDVGWALVGLSFRHDGGMMTAHGGLLTAEGLVLEGVSWGAAPEESDSLRKECDEPGALLSVAQEARRVAFDDGVWSVEQLRVGPWPIGGISSERRGSSGFLPPTLRATQLRAELQGDYWIAPAAALTVTGDSRGRVGVGVGLLTHRREQIRRLDAVAGWNLVEGMAEPLVVGDIALGDDLHLRGDVEHPAASELWQFRQLERDAFFRDFRETSVGVSLGGPGHALQSRLTYLSAPERLEPELGVGVRYASRFDARFTEFDVDLWHTSRRSEQTAHSSTAVVEGRAPIGSPRRAWVTPGAAVAANFGAVTASSGFDASTTFSVLGLLDAGLAFQGRYAGGATHDLAPRLLLGGELYGVQQRTPEEGAPPFEYQRPTAWRFVDVVLDQSVRQGEWTVAFPLGTYADVLAPSTLADISDRIRPHGRLEVRRRRASVAMDLVCEPNCIDMGFAAVARIRVAAALTAWYGLSNLDDASVRLASAPDYLSHAATAIRFVQPGEVVAEQWSHHAGLELSREGWRGHVVGRWADEPVGQGADLHFGYVWKTLGWGLGARGGYRLDETWSIIGGLSLAR